MFNTAILQRNLSNFSKLLRSILCWVMLALCWLMTNQHLCPVLTQTPMRCCLKSKHKDFKLRVLTLSAWGIFAFLQRPRTLWNFDSLGYICTVKSWGNWGELGLEVDLNPLTKTCCCGVEPELNLNLLKPFNLFFLDSLEMAPLQTWKLS